MQGMLAELKQNTFTTPLVWRDILNIHKQQNAQKCMKSYTDTQPLNYFNALGAVRDVLRENQDIYLVNEGQIPWIMHEILLICIKPRRRLDCGTWGVMGIGMGYAIGASVTSGSPVVAIEGDSAFGFSGMEIETICRYNLPVTIVIFNNGGIYRGDGVDSAALVHHRQRICCTMQGMTN